MLLEALGDERAPRLLAAGKAQLSEYADRLPDDEARRSFLEGVWVNKRLWN
jgi:hypothetical protein